MKVLFGTDYTESRLYGIIAEMFYAQMSRLARQNDVTIMLTGQVTTNSITGDVGYIINPDSQYFNLLPTIHMDRLVDVVDGDGWIATSSES